MTLASLGLFDLPPATGLMLGIVLLLMSVIAYQVWALARAKRQIRYQVTELTGAYPRYRPWQELSLRIRALRAIMIISFAVSLTSGLTVASIETAALTQPKRADAQFIHPHHIKRGVRFFTDGQEKVYAVTKPLMIGFWVVTLALKVMNIRVEDNWRERKNRDLLDRLTSEL